MNIACPNCSQGLTIPGATAIGSPITCGACRHRWAFAPAHVGVQDEGRPFPLLGAVVCTVWLLFFVLAVAAAFSVPNAGWYVPFAAAIALDRCYHAVKP